MPSLPQRPHLSPQERLRLRVTGSELLQHATSAAERLEGSRLVLRAMALPPEIELDESLCRRAGIPMDLLPLLRGPDSRRSA